MGHSLDRDLLCLVQDEVKDLIKDYSTIHSQLNVHDKQIAQLEVNVATLTDQDQRKETRLVEHHKRLEALEENLHVQQAAEIRSEEIGKILKRLMSFETQLSIRLQTVEEKVDQLEQVQTKTDDRVSQLEQKYTEVTAKVDQLDQKCIEVEQIRLQMKTQEDKPGKLRLWSGTGCLKPTLKCSLK